MRYYVFFKNSTTKAPITGLTLTWAYLVKGADGTAFTPQPAFTELAGGYYTFSISPTQDLLGRIDGGSALASQDRYAEVALTASDAYLDAAVSSRSTFAGEAVASVTGPVTVGTNQDKTGYSLTAAYDSAKTAAQAGDAMALTNGERASLATVIEGHLLNDADGQALLQAIVNKINATDVDLAGLSVSAIASASASAILAVPGNKLTTDGTGRVTVGTVEDKSGYALTADYDRAKAAAAPEEIPTPDAVAGSVWSSPLRTLTGFGTLVTDVVAGVWNAAARTLTAFAFSVTATEVTDKTGYTLTANYDAAKTAASQQSVDTAAQAIMTAITNVATDEDMQTLLARLTEARAELLDMLGVPAEDPRPVVVINRPNQANLQVLWGIAKELGQGWAEGDTVTVTPVGKNQHPGGYLLPLIPKNTTVAADGTFSIEVDKKAQVIVEVGNYYSKTITISEDDDRDLSTY